MNYKEDNKLKDGIKSPTFKNPYRSPDFRTKWELGIWGYIILGVLFLFLVYFLGPADIALLIVAVILLIKLWTLWFFTLKRSLWELIVLYVFLGYLFSRF